jgi:hypothetical protein
MLTVMFPAETESLLLRHSDEEKLHRVRQVFRAAGAVPTTNPPPWSTALQQRTTKVLRCWPPFPPVRFLLMQISCSSDERSGW